MVETQRLGKKGEKARGKWRNEKSSFNEENVIFHKQNVFLIAKEVNK